MKYTKNVLMKGLILFAIIYQMHAVLNLLIIHEKQKIGKVKQNRKLKKTVNLRVRCTWFKQGRTDE